MVRHHMEMELKFPDLSKGLTKRVQYHERFEEGSRLGISPFLL